MFISALFLLLFFSRPAEFQFIRDNIPLPPYYDDQLWIKSPSLNGTGESRIIAGTNAVASDYPFTVRSILLNAIYRENIV